jgi:hypothetical protein
MYEFGKTINIERPSHRTRKDITLRQDQSNAELRRVF